jgi:hypothetical protein
MIFFFKWENSKCRIETKIYFFRAYMCVCVCVMGLLILCTIYLISYKIFREIDFRGSFLLAFLCDERFQ